MVKLAGQTSDMLHMGQNQRLRTTHLVAIGLAVLFARYVYGTTTNDSPQSFTLDGQLLQAGTQNPLLDSSAKITVDILDPSKTCLLYEEQQTVDTSTTNGYYNIQIGSLSTTDPKRTASDPHQTMPQIFQNMTAITANSVPGQTCAGGQYTPGAGDIRYFRITVTPSATGVADTLSPDTILGSVPQALVAQTLEGIDKSNILQVNTAGGVNLTQSNLESAFTGTNYTNFQSVMSGNYMPKSTTGAADLPTYTTASPPSTPVAGSLWYDSTANTIKYYDGTTTQTLASGSSVTPSGAAGAVQISGGTALSNDATNFFWDSTNHRLGVGTATPNNPIDARGNPASKPVISGANSDTTSASYGVYGSTASGTSGASGVYGLATGNGSPYGVAGIANNAAGSGVGVYGSSASTATGTGVYGSETGANNTGYAGYFLNNSATGWGVYSSGTSPNYFAGSVGVGTNATAPATNLDVRNDSASTVYPIAAENESAANSGVGAGIEFLGKNGSGTTQTQIATIEGQWDAANNNGDLTFRTNDNGTMYNAMTIDFGGGIGFPWRTNYVGFDVKNSVSSQGTGVAYGTELEQTIKAGAANDALTGLVINPTFNDNAQTGVTHNGLLVESGNVGIGTATPRAGFDVSNGSVVTKPATSNATSTIDFSTGNIQYTGSSCGTFQFNNLKDGGTYTFIVKGTTAATCTFTGYSDAGVTALTVHMPPDNGATTAGKQTLFSILVAGTDAYVAWTPGY